jgi:hypothetical protein
VTENQSKSSVIKLDLKAESLSGVSHGPARVTKTGTTKPSSETQVVRKAIWLGSRKYDKERDSQTPARVPAQNRIRFYCSRCRNRIKAQYGQEGRQYNCPFCSEPGIVPYPDKPYEKPPEQDPRSWQNQKGFLCWVLGLLLLIFAYTQQNVWMPMVGLELPGTSQEASSEPSPENAQASPFESSDHLPKSASKRTTAGIFVRPWFNRW